MIELLGIGVRGQGAWRFRRVCARFENRTLAAVISSRRDERVALLDVIAGRVIPSEGRAWIDGTPLGADTAFRVRERVGVVDFATPLAPHRTVAGNVMGFDRRGPFGSLTSFSWLASSRTAVSALERVELAGQAGVLAGGLDGRARSRLVIARALRGRPGHLVVAEPDAYLPGPAVLEVLGLLRTLIRREGLSVFVSLADPDLAREADATLQIADGEAVLV